MVIRNVDGKAALVALALIGLPILQGCAEWTHLTSTRELGNGPKTLIVDAKQRVVLTSVNDGRTQYCTEPSPDALSALAAGFGPTLSKQDKLNIANSLSLSEGASSIGLRTQSIQLMRDAMYRLCEAHLSGSIDGPAYQTLHRRFQSSMVAILAIEQLTGTVRAPAVSISSSALVGKAEQAAKLTADTEAARKALRDAQAVTATAKSTSGAANKKVSDLEAQLADAKKNDDAAKVKEIELQIATARTEQEKAARTYADAQQVESDRSASFSAIDAARLQAVAGGSGSSVTVDVKLPESSKPSDAAVEHVATAVSNIVNATLGLQFGPELCTTILVSGGGTDELKKTCSALLENTVLLFKSQLTSLDATTAKIEQMSAPKTPEEVSELRKMLEQQQKQYQGLKDTLVLDPNIRRKDGA